MLAGTDSKTGVETHEQGSRTSTLPTLRELADRLERRQEREKRRERGKGLLVFSQ